MTTELLRDLVLDALKDGGEHNSLDVRDAILAQYQNTFSKKRINQEFDAMGKDGIIACTRTTRGSRLQKIQQQQQVPKVSFEERLTVLQMERQKYINHLQKIETEIVVLMRQFFSSRRA